MKESINFHIVNVISKDRAVVAFWTYRKGRLPLLETKEASKVKGKWTTEKARK